MSDNSKRHEHSTTASLFDGVRQWRFPAEFRILPPPPAAIEPSVSAPQPAAAPPSATIPEPDDRAGELELICDLATELWYVKTKHLKHRWDDYLASPDDPLMRRTLRRIDRLVDALRAQGFELEDPIGKPFRAGNEGNMDFEMLPREGIEHATIARTRAPLIFRHDQLVRKGDVEVEVPGRDDIQHRQDATQRRTTPTDLMPIEPASDETE